MVSTLTTYLLDSTNVAGIVRLVNEASRCLSMFNVDFGGVYDRTFKLLCLCRGILTFESALEKLRYGKDTSSNL